jgi:superfamily II DNA or RNA helicase
VHQQLVKVNGLDFSHIRRVAGDFNEAELEAVLVEEKHLHAVAKPTIEMAEDHTTLVFCVTVKHAEMMAEVLNRYKPGSARALSGASDKGLRRDVVEDFKAGRLQFLCNCGLFLEGFDAPATAFIIMARPTQSLMLYMQILGRGTRPLPDVVEGLETPTDRRAAIAASGKPCMTIADFVGNSGRHKIVTSADVLGGRWGEPVRQYAKNTIEDEGQPVRIEEALARAECELALENEQRERERERRSCIMAARANYSTQDINPFMGGAPFKAAVGPGPEMATEKQVRYILHLSRETNTGWTREKASKLTKQQACGVITQLLEREVA